MEEANVKERIDDIWQVTGNHIHVHTVIMKSSESGTTVMSG